MVTTSPTPIPALPLLLPSTKTATLISSATTVLAPLELQLVLLSAVLLLTEVSMVALTVVPTVALMMVPTAETTLSMTTLSMITLSMTTLATTAMLVTTAMPDGEHPKIR